MTLRLADKWLWDFWTASDGDDLHVFYLQADRALADPGLRHFNVSVGHAVTRDLETWTVLPDALAPGPDGAFDDGTTWTGSILRHDGAWHMLYTGTSRADGCLVQRVGLAISADLITWDRRPGPCFEADPRWYERLDRERWHDEAWRDPWLFRTSDGTFHAYVTARAATGEPRGRGVIGHARSADLRRWEVLPPVTAPMGIGQLEVPQLVPIAGRWYLLFSSDPSTRLPAAGLAGTGTYYLSADDPLGPFEAATLGTLEADALGRTYAGRVVEHRGRRLFLGWLGAHDGGPFAGALAPPRELRVASDGALSVAPLRAGVQKHGLTFS